MHCQKSSTVVIYYIKFDSIFSAKKDQMEKFMQISYQNRQLLNIIVGQSIIDISSSTVTENFVFVDNFNEKRESLTFWRLLSTLFYPVHLC